MITLVVTGGRHYKDMQYAWRKLDGIHTAYEVFLLVNGKASGLDFFAEEWARARGIAHVEVPADWARLGNLAGTVRNRKMLQDWSPALCAAFPGGTGTADMRFAAGMAGVPVLRFNGVD